MADEHYCMIVNIVNRALYYIEWTRYGNWIEMIGQYNAWYFPFRQIIG